MPPNHRRAHRGTIRQALHEDDWPTFIDYEAPCLNTHASGFDLATARLVQIGYAAISALSGDPLPRTLMDTFLREDGAAFDGVFALRSAQVDKIISRSTRLRLAVELQEDLLDSALESALASRSTHSATSEIYTWAADVVRRVRRKSKDSGALAFEDVTTGDYAEIVAGVRTRGEWVQLGPAGNLATYISFGGLRFHFEGRIVYIPASQGGPELVQLDLAPCLNDTFDFHPKHEDDGTGWMDHALARLQCSGAAKPFRIEGTGTPVRRIVGVHPQ